MAFVYRSENVFLKNKSTTGKKVGPGTYISHSTYQIKEKKIPFLSSLERKENINTLAPGPGTYEIANEYQKEKLIASDINLDVKIIEIPKPSSNFKSETIRFNENKNNGIPGPGEYEKTGSIELFNQKYISQKSKEASLSQIFLKNTKSAIIPSIPGTYNSFGYTETPDFALKQNKNPLIRHTGLNSDKVGPGEYESKIESIKKHHKGTNWHKSKTEKLQSFQIKEIKDIGPGSYNPIISKQYAKSKSTSSFNSKSQRLFDIRKGQISNKYIFDKLQEQSKISQASTHDSKDNWFSEKAIEDEIEYVEDSTPGPGYYYNDQLSTSFKNPRINKINKKSYDNRFKMVIKDENIGPGKYEIIKDFVKPNKKTNLEVNAPFLIQDMRFKDIEDIPGPGPGAYTINNTLDNKLKKKAKFGMKGKFLTTQRRFKIEELADQNLGPGEYIPLEKHKPNENPVYSFKSKTIRKLYDIPEGGPDMTTYNVKNYNISTSAMKDVETDPELAKKIPQFNRSEPRFLELKKMEREQEKREKELDFMEIPKGKSLESIIEPNPNNNKTPFNSNNVRFNYKIKEDNPGPGHYNPTVKIDWSKRSYNVLFAEI